MDAEYVSQLRAERLEVLKEHTRLTRGDMALWLRLLGKQWKDLQKRLSKPRKSLRGGVDADSN